MQETDFINTYYKKILSFLVAKLLMPMKIIQACPIPFSWSNAVTASY